MIQIYHHDKPFTTELGHTFETLDIAYSTYGQLSENKDNVILVCHALTANSEVHDWWPNTVEEGKFLDPKRHFILCVNMLGSPYGTTSPTSIDPKTGQPYYDNFPLITIRDLYYCINVVVQYLGIKSIELAIGSSIGGFQVLETIISDPNLVKKAILIATCAKSEPWAVAFNESQRMAIEADGEFGQKRADAAQKGLACARSIALLSYRGQEAYDKTQQDADCEKVDDFRAASYQRYQGKKLVDRFNVYSYYKFTQLVDSHNVGRCRGGVEKALSTIKTKVVSIAISSDIIYPESGHQVFVKNIPNCDHYVIESDFGHDGFLIEHQKLNSIILKYLNNE